MKFTLTLLIFISCCRAFGSCGEALRAVFHDESFEIMNAMRPDVFVPKDGYNPLSNRLVKKMGDDPLSQTSIANLGAFGYATKAAKPFVLQLSAKIWHGVLFNNKHFFTFNSEELEFLNFVLCRSEPDAPVSSQMAQRAMLWLELQYPELDATSVLPDPSEIVSSPDGKFTLRPGSRAANSVSVANSLDPVLLILPMDNISFTGNAVMPDPTVGH